MPEHPAIHEPIQPAERHGSLDALRGVAVLGILAMNIRNFALPLGEFDNPRWPRSAEPGTPTTLAASDLWTWLITNIFFEDKMITIFGLLFGAGVIVFAERADRAVRAAGASTLRAAALHYRRMFWLLVIGLAHAYLLWYGDILNTYALCGLLLWPMRRVSPGILIGLGVLALMAAIWIRQGPILLEMLGREPGTPPPPPVQSLTRDIMRQAGETEAAAYRGSWLDLFWWRAHMNTAWHFLAGLTFSLWRSLGQMLIGMGLMRLGLFAAAWRPSALIGLALGGYGIGLTLTLLGIVPSLLETIERGPDFSTGGSARGMMHRQSGHMRFIGALGIALGHTGLVLCLWQAAARAASPIVTAVRRSIESVGRMALSNYLMHTVICVLIFDGWAGDQWDRWRFHEFYTLVAAVWLAQLILSPLWLSRFRYGPVEWLWRSLTYWRVEPMRAR